MFSREIESDHEKLNELKEYITDNYHFCSAHAIKLIVEVLNEILSKLEKIRQ